MIKRTKKELSEIVKNYVLNNPAPDEKFCPNLYIKIRRQVKGQKLNLIYDFKNNRIFKDTEIPEEESVTSRKFTSYRGYDFKNNEQIISIQPMKGLYCAEYTKYEPDLKMIEYSIIQINADTPIINKNFDIENNPVYRLDKSEKKRGWEYLRRNFFFRDSIKSYDIYGEISTYTSSLIYNVTHKSIYARTDMTNYEWKKFFQDSYNYDSNWRSSFWDGCRKDYFIKLQNHLTNGNKSAQWKQKIMKTPLSLIEDISLECKSILVNREEKYDKMWNPITKTMERKEIRYGYPILVHSNGYYYEKVNDKWSVFRFVSRDIRTKDVQRHVEKFDRYFNGYKNISTKMEEHFRIYIDNKGNIFTAEYSPFLEEWVVSRSKINNLEYQYSNQSICFYNLEKAKDNEIINKYFEFISHIDDDCSKMAILTNLNTKNEVLKEMISNDLSNMAAQYCFGKGWFKTWFGIDIKCPTSLSQSECSMYQLHYLDYMLGTDAYTYQYMLREIKNLFDCKLVSISDMEFNKAFEFYNIIKEKTSNRFLETIAYVEVYKTPSKAEERLKNLFELYKNNPEETKWLDEYIEIMNKKRTHWELRHKVNDVTISEDDFGSLEGIERIKKEIIRYINETNKIK